MRRIHRQDGQAAVEFILMFPFVMLMFLFIVEFGFVLHSYISIIQSAAEAARYAAIGNRPAGVSCTSGDGTVQGRALAASTVSITCAEVTVTYPPPAVAPVKRGDTVAVRVNHVYTPKTPLGKIMTLLSAGTFPSTITMGSCFDARLESGPTVQTNVVIAAGCP